MTNKDWTLQGSAGRFIRVPEDVIYTNLKGNALLVYLVLCSKVSTSEGVVVISRETISEITGIHKSHLSAIYKQLIEKGFIHSKRQVGMNQANEFKLIAPKTEEISEKIQAVKSAIAEKRETRYNDYNLEREYSKQLEIIETVEQEETFQDPFENSQSSTKFANLSNGLKGKDLILFENTLACHKKELSIDKIKFDSADFVVDDWDNLVTRADSDRLIHKSDSDLIDALIFKHMFDLKQVLLDPIHGDLK